MQPDIDRTYSVDADKVTEAMSRRTVLVGCLAALSVVWLHRPAFAASTVTVKSLQDYREALDLLASGYRYALVDIRADWCAACLRVEREVLPHPAVRRMLETVALVKVDVTSMNQENRELLGHLRADGPPTFFVIDTANGAEQARTRSVGRIKQAELIRRLQPFASG